MAMYATRENVTKYSTEYANKQAEKDSFENLSSPAAAASAAAWSTSEDPPSSADAKVTAPANTFSISRYSDGRGFVTHPVTAGSVRRHLEASFSSPGTAENSTSMSISTPNGAEVSTNHVKITWVELPIPLTQVGSYPVPVNVRYFASKSAVESSEATVTVTVNIKHRDTA